MCYLQTRALERQSCATRTSRLADRKSSATAATRHECFTDQFIVDYFAENMTDEAQAGVLARAQLYHYDFRKANRFRRIRRRQLTIASRHTW